MTGAYATASVMLVLAWPLAAALRPVLPASRAVPAGIVLAVLAGLLLRHSLPLMVLVSVLTPASVGLSALILRSLARPFVTVRPVPFWELALFAGLFACYIAASAGAIRFDPYAVGYDPLSAGAIVLACTLYAGLRGYLLFALVPVLAQAAWLSGIGSSNYLDHLLHAIMLPVLVVSLTVRIAAGLFRLWRNRRARAGT